MGLEAVYDANAGTFLGRTAGSWFKILGFYAIYYTLLGFLFYASVLIGMIRNENQELFGRTRGIGTPPTRTRTDQPGVDAWPQQMVIEDNYGQEFELATYEKKYGDSKNDYPIYVKKVEEYLLNYCPFEKQCALENIFGDKWQETFPFVVKSNTDATKENVKDCADTSVLSRKCMVYRQFCSGNETCGKIMKIDHVKFAKEIADKDNKQINKPYFFIALNKVIGFEIMGMEKLAEMNALNPTKNQPSPTFQNFKSNGLGLSVDDLKQAAFVNCYIFDVEATKKMCKPWKVDNNNSFTVRDSSSSESVPCDNMKDQTDYKIKAIRPYILNKDYVYSGYSNASSPTMVEDNKKAVTYAKPFAMFQMSKVTESKIQNLEDKSLVRCNVVAKNIEYPYLDSEKLMDNGVLVQSGNGWVQLGFRQKDQEEGSS